MEIFQKLKPLLKKTWRLFFVIVIIILIPVVITSLQTLYKATSYISIPSQRVALASQSNMLLENTSRLENKVILDLAENEWVIDKVQRQVFGNTEPPCRIEYEVSTGKDISIAKLAVKYCHESTAKLLVNTWAMEIVKIANTTYINNSTERNAEVQQLIDTTQTQIKQIQEMKVIISQNNELALLQNEYANYLNLLNENEERLLNLRNIENDVKTIIDELKDSPQGYDLSLTMFSIRKIITTYYNNISSPEERISFGLDEKAQPQYSDIDFFLKNFLIQVENQIAQIKTTSTEYQNQLKRIQPTLQIRQNELDLVEIKYQSLLSTYDLYTRYEKELEFIKNNPDNTFREIGIAIVEKIDIGKGLLWNVLIAFLFGSTIYFVYILYQYVKEDIACK